MYETLLRPHEVQQHLPPRPLSEAVDKLIRMAVYREEKRQRQIANAGKRKREDDSTAIEKDLGTRARAVAVTREGEEEGAEGAAGSEKRARMGAEASATSAFALDVEECGETPRREIVEPLAPPEDETAATGAVAGPSQAEPVPVKLNHSKVSPDVRGHTSYLTFARLVPFPLHASDPIMQQQDVLAHTS